MLCTFCFGSPTNRTKRVPHHKAASGPVYISDAELREPCTKLPDRSIASCNRYRSLSLHRAAFRDGLQWSKLLCCHLRTLGSFESFSRPGFLRLLVVRRPYQRFVRENSLTLKLVDVLMRGSSEETTFKCRRGVGVNKGIGYTARRDILPFIPDG